MQYAFAHAPKGATFVAKGAGTGTAPEVVRLMDDPLAPGKKKADFLTATLKPGDEVFMDLGGPGDRLALAAIAHDARVLRVPAFRFNAGRALSLVSALGWKVSPERSRGGETGDKLTDRKVRALAIFALAHEEPDAFYPAEQQDVSLLRLKALFRSFSRAKKGYLRAYQALLAAYRDQALIAHAFAAQTTAAEPNTLLEQMLRDMLGGEVSDADRASFFAMIGKEFEGGRLPDVATEETIEKIVDAMIASDRFQSTVLDRVKALQREIEKILKGGKKSPANFLWEMVFEPIPGCGPLIAARIITATADIRRFETLPAYKAYAGYHQFEDGSRARRVAGKVSNWSPELKQAVYLWCVQTVKTPSSPWRQKLDARNAYELWKLLKEKQREANAAGITVALVPEAYASPRKNAEGLVTVESFMAADYAALATHLDDLRKLAGVKGPEEVEEEDEAPAEESAAAMPGLAQYVRGLKGAAHDKGLRWLGQQFLKHVYCAWREALDLPKFPEKHRKPVATAETPAS